MSQAPVGQRSAHRPQCRQTSSSLTMTRPVFSVAGDVEVLGQVQRRRLQPGAQLGLVAVGGEGDAVHRADVDAGVAFDAQRRRRTPSGRRSSGSAAASCVAERRGRSRARPPALMSLQRDRPCRAAAP